MDMNAWLEGQLSANIKKPMPILSFPSVSLLDVTVRELINDSGLQSRGMKMIAERVDAGAALSMMDLSVEAEAFGAQIRVSDDEVPTVIGRIVCSMEDAQALKIPQVGDKRTGVYIEAIEKACKLIKDRPVLAGVIGPFSLAGRLMDVSEAMVNCYTEPDLVHKVMEKTAASLTAYIKAYKSIGANGVVIAEPLTGLLSPELAAAFSEPYVKSIIDAVCDQTFCVVYHNCGNNTIQMIDSILRTGASAYHFGNAISMKQMLKLIPKDTLVMGNVDPSAYFRNGTPESITAETIRIMSECCPKHPNFVISSGCDIPPGSKWENIDAFFKAAKDYYAGN